MGRTGSTVALAVLMAACSGGSPEPTGERMSVIGTLAGADTAGYARAYEPMPLRFPEDHGPHPEYRTEWWYVTGNLATDRGRELGFQLTIFRSALSPEPPPLASDWATNQAYMAHFALTDVQGGEAYAFERFARGAAGLAGASAEPFRSWVGDWSLEGGSDTPFPMLVSAADGPVALRLTLEAGKPRVLHGDRGLSRKGSEPGNASYYYAHTRMPASGTVVVDADTLSVSGAAWLDREWSTSALSGDQVGWDWLALQLADGWDLMVYRMRLRDGSADAWSAGALVDPTGARIPLEYGTEIELQATDTWRSPVDGAEYPSGWRVRLPARGWDLTVEPLVADQELDLSFRYWEGAVAVTGVGEAGASVTGRGYVELTGYAGAPPRR